MIRQLAIVIVATAALAIVGGCRPKGEVVRYMSRPPAKVVHAPQDGTYLLYPGIDEPAILVEELKAGQPVGFKIVESQQGGRSLVAVVGDDQSLRLDRGSRYAWMLQEQMDQSAQPDGVPAGGDVRQQRLEAAQRALDQAAYDLDRARKNHEAAERRLKAAQADLEKN